MDSLKRRSAVHCLEIGSPTIFAHNIAKIRMTEASSLAEDLDSDEELDFDFGQDGRRLTPASLRKSDTEQTTQRQSAIEQRKPRQHSPRGPQYVTRANEIAQEYLLLPRLCVLLDPMPALSSYAITFCQLGHCHLV